MTVMVRSVNHEEVENNISCVDVSFANALCRPLFMVTGRRAVRKRMEGERERGEKKKEKNLRVFKFSVQETRLGKKCRLSRRPIF